MSSNQKLMGQFVFDAYFGYGIIVEEEINYDMICWFTHKPRNTLLEKGRAYDFIRAYKLREKFHANPKRT